MIHRTIRRGKKLQKGASRWDSGYIQPTGKWQKRLASTKVRRSKEVANGNAHKQTWGPFEWS